MVSTFPPRPCGIATFAEHLTEALRSIGARVDEVELSEAAPTSATRAAVLIEGQPLRTSAALKVANQADVVVLQHEYGIWGGPSGEEVLAFSGATTSPLLVVAHTVLSCPTPDQRRILEALCLDAAVVVVMSHWAQRRLTMAYDVDPGCVVVIPHGAATRPQLPDLRQDGTLSLLTWGLLGPGKGVENVLDALALLGHDAAKVHYRIAGATHPKVLAHEGEAYRNMLMDKVADLGLASSVHFDQRYLAPNDLDALLRQVSLVVLPYDSIDQVTSGVLVDALGAGKPVLSTNFPHAIELLSGGAGVLVDRANPMAIAAELRRLLAAPSLLDTMSRAATALAPSLQWRTVAEQYLKAAAAVDASRTLAGSRR